jgi:aquaglyceroporin related protein
MGACLIMGNYKNLLDKFEGGPNLRTYGLETSTAALFFTDTKPYMTNIGTYSYCPEYRPQDRLYSHH